MDTAAVQLDEISVHYGNRVAVDRLSLVISRGEILGLLGPNGSGKSSTLAAIAGLRELAGGSIRIAGIARHEQPSRYAHQIGYVPQVSAVYDELSVFDNLDFFGALYDLKRRVRRARMSAALEQVGLSPRANDRVDTLSGGMKQRLSFAIALIHDPPVLLLDEPTAAIDPISRDTLFQLLNDLRDRGHSIVLTTHQLEEAEQWCDRVCILQQGRAIGVGRPSDVLHSAGIANIEGQLREELDEHTEARLHARLGKIATLSVNGRRFHLRADDVEHLGMALAVLASAGLRFESFRTPPARFQADSSGRRVDMLFPAGETACFASLG